MPGHNHLRNSRHANHIAAQNPKHLIFGRGFERWPLYANINTFLDINLVFKGNEFRLITQLLAVNLTHIRESGPQLIDVFAMQRVLGEHVDVVADNHQITDLVIRV